MAQCASCGRTILFGGKKSVGLRFCNDKCEQRSALVSAMAEVPTEITQKYAEFLHGGSCPKCGGQGPVDVHTSYRVWSAMFLTSWKSKPEICCRTCGNKGRAISMGYSLLLGWWGFPWGLIMTPVQVTHNLIGLFRHPDPTKPSAELLRMARLDLAKKVLQARQQGNAQR
jgi:hypothetical protein